MCNASQAYPVWYNSFRGAIVCSWNFKWLKCWLQFTLSNMNIYIWVGPKTEPHYWCVVHVLISIHCHSLSHLRSILEFWFQVENVAKKLCRNSRLESLSHSWRTTRVFHQSLIPQQHGITFFFFFFIIIIIIIIIIITSITFGKSKSSMSFLHL